MVRIMNHLVWYSQAYFQCGMVVGYGGTTIPHHIHDDDCNKTVK
jgi:hypothetical protein